MSFLLSLLTLTTVIILSILLFFVLSKLMWLEKATNSLLNREGQPKGTPAIRASDVDPYFYGLSDEVLWKSLSGSPDPSIGELELSEIRPRFAMALDKMITRLVKEAPSSQSTTINVTRNALDITNVRGKIRIWIPPHHAEALTKLGSSLKVNAEEVDQTEAVQTLQDIVYALYSEVALEWDQESFSTMSQALIVQPTSHSQNAD